MFPQTKVIIQIRENINAQSKSGWHKDDPHAQHFLKKTTKELIDYAIQNKEYCYLTSFERMFDKKNMKKIFNFINCDCDYNEKLIDDVLKDNIKE